MPKKKNNSSPSKKLLCLLELEPKHLGRWLTKNQSFAIRHLPDKEDLIKKVFKNCVILTLLMKTRGFKNSISCILVSRLKSSWTIFLGKLSTLEDLNILTIHLFKTLAQESTSSAKAYRPFWTPAYKELSEKLWLPIKTGFPDLGMTSSKYLSKKQVEKLPCLMQTRTNLQNKNSQTTCYQLSISSVADKWEEENIKDLKKTKFKTIPVKLYLTEPQKKLYKEYSDCFRYVHNKALERVKVHKEQANFQDLRNKLVTVDTKIGSEVYSEYEEKIKDMRAKGASKEDIAAAQKAKRNALKSVEFQENLNVSEWEQKIHKDTRSAAVKKVCDSYKTARSNLKAGNIKFFDISYMKKTQKKQCVVFCKSQVKLKNGIIRIPCFKKHSKFQTSSKMKKKLKKLKINNDCDVILHKNEYYIHILVPLDSSILSVPEKPRFCGVDPGLVKFATTFGNTEVVEYTHNRELLLRLNQRIKHLKERRSNIRVRKRSMSKLEKRKIDYTNQLHWEFISSILKDNDVVYFGDIKSHGIVKNGKNKYLNQEFNDIKFYVLKQRLIYKATTMGKKVVLVNEYLTSKCCSECGSSYNVGKSRKHSCPKCGDEFTDRDVNAAKNILMKGILN